MRVWQKYYLFVAGIKLGRYILWMFRKFFCNNTNCEIIFESISNRKKISIQTERKFTYGCKLFHQICNAADRTTILTNVKIYYSTNKCTDTLAKGCALYIQQNVDKASQNSASIYTRGRKFHKNDDWPIWSVNVLCISCMELRYWDIQRPGLMVVTSLAQPYIIYICKFTYTRCTKMMRSVRQCL